MESFCKSLRHIDNLSLFLFTGWQWWRCYCSAGLSCEAGVCSCGRVQRYDWKNTGISCISQCKGPFTMDTTGNADSTPDSWVPKEAVWTKQIHRIRICLVFHFVVQVLFTLQEYNIMLSAYRKNTKKTCDETSNFYNFMFFHLQQRHTLTFVWPSYPCQLHPGVGPLEEIDSAWLSFEVYKLHKGWKLLHHPCPLMIGAGSELQAI